MRWFGILAPNKIEGFFAGCYMFRVYFFMEACFESKSVYEIRFTLDGGGIIYCLCVDRVSLEFEGRWILDARIRIVRAYSAGLRIHF